MIEQKIEESWEKVLHEEFKKPYFLALKAFLLHEKNSHTIYPPSDAIFNAFNHTPFEKVKVVILGQDPYHGENQAHGLSFSVTKGTSFPPSLRNIFQELKEDMGCPVPQSGDLSGWAMQGVFLLNTVLTVRANEANSHRKQGWENFTDVVIKNLSEQREHLVFILWGAPAFKKANLIDTQKHLILTSPHPSPLSSYRGFFGSKPFSKSNDFLTRKGISPVNWCLDATKTL